MRSAAVSAKLCLFTNALVSRLNGLTSETAPEAAEPKLTGWRPTNSRLRRMATSQAKRSADPRRRSVRTAYKRSTLPAAAGEYRAQLGRAAWSMALGVSLVLLISLSLCDKGPMKSHWSRAAEGPGDPYRTRGPQARRENWATVGPAPGVYTECLLGKLGERSLRAARGTRAPFPSQPTRAPLALRMQPSRVPPARLSRTRSRPSGPGPPTTPPVGHSFVPDLGRPADLVVLVLVAAVHLGFAFVRAGKRRDGDRPRSSPLRHVACRLLLVASMLSGAEAIFEKGASEISLSALDCFHPKTVVHANLMNICAPPVDPDAGAQTAAQEQAVTILQHEDEIVLKGYRCTMKQTTLFVYCGAYSHEKLLRPPAVLEPQVVTIGTCKTAYKNGMLRDQVRRNHIVTVNQKLYYKMFRHGSTHADVDNVHCEGETFSVDGRMHKSMLEMVSVEFLMEEVELEYSPGSLKDLYYNVQLPTRCQVDRECTHDLATYVVLEPRTWCPLKLIRTIPMETVTVRARGQERTGLVSHAHKVFLLEETEYQGPTTCRFKEKLLNTNFDKLKVVRGALRTYAAELAQDGLDLDLEVRVLSEYKAFVAERSLEAQQSDLAQALCKMTQHNLHSVEISPFNQDALLRVSGEVLNELRCTRVTVQVKLRTSAGYCTLDGLPAYHKGQLWFVQPVTRLLIKPEDARKVKCDNAYLPVFVVNGSMALIADPDVRVYNSSIVEWHVQDAGRGGREHEEFSDDLLYTKAEIDQFNFLIHFSRTRQNILSSITENYCATEGECGTFRPQRPYTPFNLANLEERLDPEQYLIHYVQRYVEKVGLIGGALYLMQLVLQALRKLYIGYRLYFVKRTNLKSTLHLTFNLDSSMREQMLRRTLPDQGM